MDRNGNGIMNPKLEEKVYLPIYLDYNATTPLDEQVIEEIHTSLIEDWGNPSSAHVYGVKAKVKIEQSRESVGKMLNANSNDIIFTSGGTEANNVALISAIDNAITSAGIDFVPHVITSNVEHDSVANVLKEQVRLGKINLSTANVDEYGRLNLETVLSLINDSTRLVSIMHANNETGVVMPIEEIGDELRKVNEIRKKNGKAQIYFHCDAAQTVGKIRVDVERLKVDYLTVVGHKFYAPRIGALFVRGVMEGTTPIKPLVLGGGQERGLRPGTENTPMIAGFGKAAQLVYENQRVYFESMKNLKLVLSQKLKDDIPGLKLNFTEGEILPNTLSVCLPEGHQASDILRVKCKGKFLASLGAACHSNVEKPSAILLASGLPPSEATRTIRVSIGRTTSMKEVEIAVKILQEAMNLTNLIN